MALSEVTLDYSDVQIIPRHSQYCCKKNNFTSSKFVKKKTQNALLINNRDAVCTYFMRQI